MPFRADSILKSKK